MFIQKLTGNPKLTDVPLDQGFVQGQKGGGWDVSIAPTVVVTNGKLWIVK